MPAICRVMYSMVTGSSTVSRWLWHSIRALSMSTRPSAVRPGEIRIVSQPERYVHQHAPAKARQTWSSSITTFRTVRGSCSCRTDFFSTPRTTTFSPRTPTLQPFSVTINDATTVNPYSACSLSHSFVCVLDLEVCLIRLQLSGRVWSGIPGIDGHRGRKR